VEERRFQRRDDRFRIGAPASAVPKPFEAAIWALAPVSLGPPDWSRKSMPVKDRVTVI
jgi:hypothetical protein